MSRRVPLTELDERDELSCGHNPFLEVYYQDQRFTGIGYEARADSIDEYAYVDGYGHGRCTTTARDGQLLEEFFLAHGHHVGDARRWFVGGQLAEYRRHDRPPLVRRFLTRVIRMPWRRRLALTTASPPARISPRTILPFLSLPSHSKMVSFEPLDSVAVAMDVGRCAVGVGLGGRRRAIRW